MSKTVLVVDDSALMRKRLSEIISNAGYRVETANNGVQCLERVRALKPDAVTLDIHMPEMNGLDCLEQLMTDQPLPVVMVSSLTSENAEATLKALSLGAVDVVEKPGGTVSLKIGQIEEELITKLDAAFDARVRRRTRGSAQRTSPPPAPPRPRMPRTARMRRSSAASFPIILVGVSTGGPRIVESVIGALRPDLEAAIVIAQHMPRAFTATFARRLNDCSAVDVVELTSRSRLEPGRCFVCQGGSDAVLVKRDESLFVQNVPDDGAYAWHPSVERLVDSAMAVSPAEQLIGVMLTGMGDDGAKAMAELHRAGGHTIAESEDSALVFGMPRALIAANGASDILPAEEIGARLNDIIIDD